MKTKAFAAGNPAPITRRPKRWRVWLYWLGCGAVGIAVGHGLEELLPKLMAVGDFSKAQKFGVLALAPPAMVLGILVHELGHVAGGKLAGFRFLLLLVGPFKLQRTPSGLRVGLNFSANLAGGLACLLPRDDRNLARRMGLFIAGGPVASLAFAVAAGWGGWVWYRGFSPQMPPSYAELLGALGLMITGAISLALFVASAWPGSAGGFFTDGRRLAMLARKGPGAERDAALTMLVSASASGVRARDYPAHLVSRVAESADDSVFGLMGKLLAYYHALDRGEVARAGGLLGEVIAGVVRLPRMTQESVHAEHAYWLAVYGGEVLAARAALGRAGKGAFDPATRLRAEAAVLRAEGDQAGAKVKAEAALVALRKRSLSLKPSAEFVEWCEALRG